MDDALRRGEPAYASPGPEVTARSAGALPKSSWFTLAEAAAFLRIDVITLRRSLERNTRKSADGTTLARVEGITARKLGRHWRVWLDAEWLNPAAQK